MNIRWLILFSAVAEEGSFTRAAGRLNVAQPWVSAQVRKLELELGIELFERTKSGIELTREGMELLPLASQVAEGARRFRDLARTMGDVRSKVVRLGSHLPMIQLGRLHRLNNEYLRRYGNFSIETERAASPALLAAVEEGTLDIAACLGPVVEADGRFESLVAARTAPYLLAPRDAPVDATALDGQVLGVPDGEAQPAFFAPLFAGLRQAGASLRPVPEAGLEAMEHHVRQGRGAVLMVEGDAAAYAGDVALAAVAIKAAPATTLLVRSARREPGRAALRYWEMAVTELAGH